MTDRYSGKGSFEEWPKEWAMEDRYNFKTIEKKMAKHLGRGKGL